MKKTAVLLAGLLLVSGTVFAEGWEVSKGVVQGTFNLIDSEEGMNVENNDVDLNIKWSKDVKEGVTASIEVAADEDGDSSVEVGFEATEGDFTVATGADWDTSANTATTKGGSDTYIAWNVMGSETITATLYPYEVDGLDWDNDTFAAFDMFNDGGVKVDVKINDDTTVTAKWAIKDNDNGDNVNAFRGDVSTKIADISLDAYVGLVPEVTEASQDSVVAMGAKGSMTLDAFTLSGEFNTETEGDADAKVGMYGKVAMDMGDMNGYEAGAYASAKVLNAAAGDTTTLEAGLDLTQGSFTVTPKVEIETAGTDAYDEEAGSADSTDSKTVIGVKIAYSL